MWRQIHFGLAIMCALAHFAPVSASVAPPARASSELPDDVKPMILLLNQHRGEAGLAPVEAHGVLHTCADRYSEVLAQQGRLSHAGPDGSNPGDRLRSCGYEWRHYGENLAAGQHHAAEAIAAWMASPSHRRIMLSPRLREVGVGYTYREGDPARYYEYFVLLFGTR